MSVLTSDRPLADAQVLESPAAGSDTTIIPKLGITFAAAQALFLELIRRSDETDGEEHDTAADAAGRLRGAIITAHPRTAADALVILQVLGHPNYGVTDNITGGEDLLPRVAAILSTAMRPTVLPIAPVERPSVGSETQADLMLHMVNILAKHRRPHPDAALLAFGRDLETAWAAQLLITNNENPSNDELDAAVVPGFAIANKILATPATILEGLKVKARAVLWCGYDEHEAGPQMFDGETTDLQLAGSIIADLIKAGAVGSTGDAHPDTALLEAWRGYTEGFRAFYAACDQMSQEEASRFHAIHTDHHRKVIEHAIPQTAVGYAVQLRFLFAALMECRDSERSALDGEPFSEDLAATLEGDYRPRMLWRMAEAATRAAAEAGHPLFPTDTTPAASSPSHAQPEPAR